MSDRQSSRPGSAAQDGSAMAELDGSAANLRDAAQTAPAGGGHVDHRPDGAGAHRAARLVGVTSLAHFLNDGVVFFVPVIGDLLSQNHRVSTTMITAMLTTFYVVSAGSGLGIGLVADRLGRRGQMIAVGIALLGVSLLGFYGALSLAGGARSVLVILAAVLAGFGSAFYHPLGGSILQLGVPAGARGKALGINGAFGSLGRALYPALFFLVATVGISKPTTTVVFGVLSILAAAVVAFGLPADVTDPERRTHAGKAVAPAAASAGVPAAASAGAPAAAPVADRKPVAVPLRSLINRSVVALTGIAFFRSLGFIGVVSWIPIYLSSERHAGLSTSLGFTVTVMYAGGILGQPLFGLLVDRFDKRLVLAIDSLGSAGGIFFFLSTSGLGAQALLALFVFGVFTFSGFPLLMSLVADYVPKSSSTTGNALVWGLGSTGGQALSPLVVGLLTGGSHANLGAAFAILGGLIAATVAATPLLRRSARSSRMALFG
ncbi:MAG: MFS transporter [Solirubrobacteraceae bacterium]